MSDKKGSTLELQTTDRMDTFQDDDNDSLEPLDVQRSQSIPQNPKQASKEVSSVLEGYRKWKQWNKKGNSSEENEDMTSAFSSPLRAVLQFAKMSRISNPQLLTNAFESHFVGAALRVEGLRLHNQLIEITRGTIYDRFAAGSLAVALQGQSVFHKVETCGELVSGDLIELSLGLLRKLMSNVILYKDTTLKQIHLLQAR